MGWWKIGADSDQDLYTGDEPLDIVTDMLVGLSQVYQERLGRKPRLAETLKAIEICLGSAADEYLSDGDELEVIGLQVRTKKRRSKQLYQIGDFFAVPLGPKQFGFGRILDISPEYGILVAIFDFLAERMVRPEVLGTKPYLFSPVSVDPDFERCSCQNSQLV